MNTTEKKDTDILREFFKQYPRFYYAIANFFGPAYIGFMSPKDFLKQYFFVKNKEHIILNLGSGPKILRDDIINVDATPYKEVDIVADMMALPFDANSVHGIISETALEHVRDPQAAIKEMYRVLCIDGVGYITLPFLYPFHASPSDYTRWTEEGLRVLLKDFKVIEIGTRSGLFSVLNQWLCYLIPALFSFGSDRMYWLLVNLSLFIFFPIKFLDVVANKLPFANRTASILYCVFIKKY